MMLTPEQAQARLQSARIPEVENWRLERIPSLPDTALADSIHQAFIQWQKQDMPASTSLRGVAYGLVGYDSSGKRIVQKGQFTNERAQAVYYGSINALAHLSAADRTAVFQVFFPKIAVHIEQLWQFLPRLPYQVGYVRKAFRAPGHEELYFAPRSSLVSHYLNTVGLYNEDIIWYTEHAAYLNRGYGSDPLGQMLAAVIDAGGEAGNQVFDILLASARGEHETGAMGRHVTRALLSASRPDGWTFVEKLLLAAQREEGLRQVVLEAVDEAHPEAFRRMLRLILEHDLSRFSAVTRAMNVWLNYGWDSENVRLVNSTLEQVLTLLESSEAQHEALQSGSGEVVYLALWVLAGQDVFRAIEAASPLLSDASVERRFAVVQLLSSIGLEASNRALIPALDDPDLRVAVTACYSLYSPPAGAGVFEKVEALLNRVTAGKALPSAEPLIWPWSMVAIDEARISQVLINALEDRSPKRLIPHFPRLSYYAKHQAIQKLVAVGMHDPEVRALVLRTLGDRHEYLRSTVLEILAKQTIQPDESLYLESLLTRKADDLRRGVFTLLARQADADALVSADRLLAARNPEQRLGGLELLALLNRAGRAVQACVSRAARYSQARAEMTDVEKNLIESITQAHESQPTLADAFGLMHPAGRSRPTPPVRREVALTSKAAVASLLSLDALIHEHRSTPLYLPTWQNTNQELLLGNVNYQFPATNPLEPIEAVANQLPLRDLWEQWVETRPGDLLDDDGLELVRALLQLNWFEASQTLPFLEALDAEDKSQLKLNYRPLLHRLLPWLIRLYPAPNTADFWLDSLETICAEIPEETLRARQEQHSSYLGWRSHLGAEMVCLGLTRSHRGVVDSDWEDHHHIRLWGLLRWIDEPLDGLPRNRPALEEVLTAYQLGVATVDDLYDQLLGPHTLQGRSRRFDDLERLSGRKPNRLFQTYPVLSEVFERCRQRVLDLELRRGEMPNEATDAASALRTVVGTDWFVRILQALGKREIARERFGQSRTISLSRLLLVSVPAPDETPEQFAKSIKAARIPENRLIEAAVYAPQWAALVEHALRWKGLTDAIWWLHAHTKDTKWFIDQALRDEWAASISERTPLSGRDLLEGAVDVDWFWQAYRTLGAARWETVYAAAKYSSGGIGHNRAKQFADAMLGKLDADALVKRIVDKRHQDSVRALGLLPLPRLKRDDEILHRYQILQTFLRGSRKFGPQRRESEKLAVETAMNNLARAAGYPDPARLGWMMEAREAADLRDGAIRKTVEDVTITLSIDMVGKPQLTIERAGKVLKSVPAKLKKSPDFVALRERKTRIDQQHARMRASLESAMCRADTFSGKELASLLEHPVLTPMLEQLVFTGEGIMGYPVDGGLMRHDGSVSPIPAEMPLRVAHAYDLFQSNEWHLWQQECFRAERIQPFKQVFRELYLLMDAERQEGAVSRRYAGHQVQPRQAIALLGSRGWLAHPDYGVQKTFHRQGLSAHLNFLGGYFTPAEVEGLTLENVVFTRTGQWKPVQLAELPPILFSEVMRDLDLVVSVAHRGGVDPETTTSTIDMRTALIRETCTLLKIANVILQGSHALIEGKLGSYSVHLGSAIVHRQPGGALCIIPVHAQHRGRLFLPFADDDPKTAETISKVLLLARDTDIKDPSILEQIFAKG